MSNTLLEESHFDVSIIIPIYNGSKWISACFNSIINQSAKKLLKLQVCICNDASTDQTADILECWKSKFKDENILFTIFTNPHATPKGVGYAKNRAVDISFGEYLCFQDIDDEMMPERILTQFNFAQTQDNNTLIGCKFRRTPEKSTERYSLWANNLSLKQLNEQVYTSHGPTVIMPTWFCHRDVFTNIGGFSEAGKGTPEDLLFFNKHLDMKGKIARVDETLLMYTYHPEATTFSIKEETIWKIRVSRLESNILTNWGSFTIWNAGKQGRKLYHSLNEDSKSKVIAFCDVDVKKISRKYTPFDPIERKAGQPIDIIHFSQAIPPIIICVKQNLSNGEFERNLSSLNLIETEDYIVFS